MRRPKTPPEGFVCVKVDPGSASPEKGTNPNCRPSRSVLSLPLLIGFILIMGAGLNCYLTLREKRRLANSATMSLTSAQSEIRRYERQSSATSGLFPGVLESYRMMARAIPNGLEALEDAATEIDDRWFGWLYDSGVKGTELEPNIQSLKEVLALFALSCYREGIELYKAGAGRAIGSRPYVSGKEEIYGYRDVSAIEDALDKYYKDLCAYTIVKLILVGVAAVMVTLVAFLSRIALLKGMNLTPNTDASQKGATTVTGASEEQDKAEFVKLRASGRTLASIVWDLGISSATAMTWDMELRSSIEALREEMPGAVLPGGAPPERTRPKHSTFRRLFLFPVVIGSLVMVAVGIHGYLTIRASSHQTNRLMGDGTALTQLEQALDDYHRDLTSYTLYKVAFSGIVSMVVAFLVLVSVRGLGTQADVRKDPEKGP